MLGHPEVTKEKYYPSLQRVVEFAAQTVGGFEKVEARVKFALEPE